MKEYHGVKNLSTAHEVIVLSRFETLTAYQFPLDNGRHGWDQISSQLVQKDEVQQKAALRFRRHYYGTRAAPDDESKVRG